MLAATHDPYGEPDDVPSPPPREPKLGEGIVTVLIDGKSSAPRKLVKLEAWKVIVADDEPNHFIVYRRDDYGRTWLYSDDPAVRPLTDLDLQLAAIRIRRRALGGAMNPRSHREAKVPACKVCGEWPCKEKKDCPDYLALAIGASEAREVRAERAERRFERFMGEDRQPTTLEEKKRLARVKRERKKTAAKLAAQTHTNNSSEKNDGSDRQQQSGEERPASQQQQAEGEGQPRRNRASNRRKSKGGQRAGESYKERSDPLAEDSGTFGWERD